MATRIPLEIGPEAIRVSFLQLISLKTCPETLSKAQWTRQFDGGKHRQDSFQATAWALSAAFSQAYSEHQDQKAEWKGWEAVQFIQKHLTWRTRSVCLFRRFNVISKEPSTLHWNNWKDASRESQQLARPNLRQDQDNQGSFALRDAEHTAYSHIGIFLC